MMEKTWRWFGKKDKITLPMLRQIGVEELSLHCMMYRTVKYGQWKLLTI